MQKIKVEYLNYNEILHKEFPRILQCNVYEKNEIINIDLKCSNIVLDVYDDINYDTQGKCTCVSIGQWHNNQTGKSIYPEEFVELDEYSVYDYEYVEAMVKIYAKENYNVYYHNYMDRNLKISLIPQKMLSFSCNDCKKKLFKV